MCGSVSRHRNRIVAAGTRTPEKSARNCLPAVNVFMWFIFACLTSEYKDLLHLGVPPAW